VNTYILPRFATAGIVVLTLSFGLTACKRRDPFDIEWIESPDTSLLFSLARPDLNLPSAFDFHLGVARVVESPSSTGQWDVILDTQDDQLIFLLPEVLGIPSQARIIELPGLAFEEVRKAPSDTTAYTIDEAVPIRLGSVYVIRTNQGTDQFGFSCLFYAKMEALEIDLTGGTLLFVHDANPLCNDQDLVPPDEN